MDISTLHPATCAEFLASNDGSKPVNQERARYVIRDAAYALQPHPTPLAIVENLIFPTGIYVLAGEAGDGKTTVDISMGVNVAAGKPFLGLQTIPTRVLFVDQDMGESWLTLRVASVLNGERCDGSTPIYYLSMPGLCLQDQNHALILQTIITENDFGLLFLDALVDFLGEADENSSTEMNPIFANLRQIADTTGAAFWIAHHLNRAGLYRGSSAIKGKVDGLFNLVREKDSPNFLIKPEKVRFGKARKLAGTLHWEDDRCWTSPAYESPEIEKPRPEGEAYVLRYLTAHGESPMSEIVNAADTCSSRAATRAIYTLAAHGEIYRTNPGESGRGVSAIYSKASPNEIHF